MESHGGHHRVLPVPLQQGLLVQLLEAQLSAQLLLLQS
jgi:hypothetical protein